MYLSCLRITNCLRSTNTLVRATKCTRTVSKYKFQRRALFYIIFSKRKRTWSFRNVFYDPRDSLHSKIKIFKFSTFYFLFNCSLPSFFDFFADSHVDAIDARSLICHIFVIYCSAYICYSPGLLFQILLKSPVFPHS